MSLGAWPIAPMPIELEAAWHSQPAWPDLSGCAQMTGNQNVHPGLPLMAAWQTAPNAAGGIPGAGGYTLPMPCAPPCHGEAVPPWLAEVPPMPIPMPMAPGVHASQLEALRLQTPSSFNVGEPAMVYRDVGLAADASPVGDRKRPQRGLKQSLLEDTFATNAFIHNVHSLARDQAGCRMLQRKLDERNDEITKAIFDEVLLDCVQLMMDPFGNYLCQKLLETCDSKQAELMLHSVQGDLVRISFNMHGARAVQKLIDAIGGTPLHLRLVQALGGAVVGLTKDANGSHVIQRCLESLPAEAHGFIFQAIVMHLFEVASDRHGCRIVQRCIDAARDGCNRQEAGVVSNQPEEILLLSDQLHRQALTALINAICAQALMLVQDPFGNYAVQYVLGLQDPKANSAIIHSMLGHLNVLSRQKFSSNVVEKCLQLANPEDKQRMISELCERRVLSELLRDVYGNYVVQRGLASCEEPLLSVLLNAVGPLLPAMRTNGHGRRIAQKLEKQYPQLRSFQLVEGRSIEKQKF